MKIPDRIYNNLRDKLWTIADRIGWGTLSDQDKSQLYEAWLADENIGGVLSRYLDAGNIRVYIKDTIMKPYHRDRIKYAGPILELLGLPSDEKTNEEFIKPHGRRLADGKVICWGQARDWKSILFAVYERAYGSTKATSFAAVILNPAGRTKEPGYRRMVEDAAKRLGIERLVWLDD